MIDIYGTLGPACADRKILREMLSLGMTGMRLNLSHMTLPEAAPMIRLLKDAAGDAGVRPQGVLTFTIRKGTPKAYPTVCFGRIVRERKDDFAWELLGKLAL